MRYLMTFAAAAVGLGAVAVSTPASAQVGVEVGVPGASVEIGEPSHRYYREERRRYRTHRDENVGYCRTEIEQRERRDGTIVERRVRRCD